MTGCSAPNCPNLASSIGAGRRVGVSLYRVIGLHNGWRRGVVVSGVRRMNQVNPRRARLVPGSVTVFGWVYHLGMQHAN